MDRAQIIDLVLKLGRGLLVIGFALLASWILSLLTPRFAQIVQEIRDVLPELRGTIEQLIGRIASAIETFWLDQSLEPHVPIVVALRKLSDSVENVPTAGVAKFQKLQNALAADSLKLRNLSESLAVESPLQVHEFVESVTTGREGFGSSVVLLFVSLAFGITNSFLLSLFFRERLGSFRLLPFPLPDLEASQALAILIAFMEIAGGFTLHAFEELGIDNPNVRFFRLVPWLVIAALTGVETIAYSALSVKMQLPTLLHIDQSSGLFPIVQYFFGFFGAVISILLAALGYILATTWKRYTTNRRHLVVFRKLKAYSRGADAIRKDIGPVKNDVVLLMQGMESLPANIESAFRNATGANPEHATLVSNLRRGVADVLMSCSPERSPAPRALRSRSQMFADLSMQLFLLVVWTGLVLLTVRTIAGYLASDDQSGSLSPAVRAWSVVLATCVFGFLARDAYPASAYATVTSATIPNPHARRAFFFAVIAGLLGTSCVIVAVPILDHSLGPPIIVNAAFGLLLAIALPLLSSGLDAAFVAVKRVAYLFAARAFIAILYACQLLSLVVDLVLFSIVRILRILSVPGDWIAGRDNPKPA